MTQVPAGRNAGSTTLVFQAPPSRPDDDFDELDDVADFQAPPTDNRGSRTGSAGPAGGPTELRMLKGARAAASGMKISDAQIRAVLEDPHDVQPDPKQPQRTQLRRDGLVVTTGNDGMILRVARRG
jgi:hypothetical protein